MEVGVRVRFVFEQALCSLRAKKVLNLIVLFSYLTGFLALFIGITALSSNFHVAWTMGFKQPGVVTQVMKNRDAPQTNIDVTRLTLDKLLQEADVQESTIVSWVNYSEISTGNSLYFCMVDNDFQNYYNFSLLSGRFFTPEEYTSVPKVCVVEGTETYKPGDVVQVGDDSYSVIGNIQSAPFRTRILIPQNTRYDLYVSGFDVVSAHAPSTFAEMDWEQTTYRIRTQTTAAVSDEMIKQAKTISATVLSVCLIAFLYMLFNTYNILCGKLEQSMRSIGIRRALGATKKAVFAQFFIETLLPMLLAMLIIFAFDPIIAAFLSHTLEHRFDLPAVLMMSTCVLMGAFLLSKAAFYRVQKKSLVKIMGEFQ